MGQFDFLKSLKLVEETTTKTTSSDPGEGLILRVFANGRVKPSKALVEAFKLEYGVDGDCGMDFFSSNDWSTYPKTEKPVIFSAFVPRTEKKISLFGSYRLVEPEKRISIFSQNVKTPELWELIKSTYAINEALYVDLVVNTELGVKTENGIYNIPKRVAKGEKKGQATYVRRENIILYPLIPVALTESKEVEQRATPVWA
jgi:hypothetical protein